jgi:hypothetical protein
LVYSGEIQMTRKVRLAAALNRTIDGRRAAGYEGYSRRDDPAAVPVAQIRVQSGESADSGFPPAVLKGLGRAFSSVIYGAGYYTSFGVVFGAMAVLHLLPLDNILFEGFRDGGAAGKDAFSRLRASTPGASGQVPAPPSSAMPA